MRIGDLVSYAGCADQYTGIIIATKHYGVHLTRHQVEWQQPGIYRGIWHNEKVLELLYESR